MGTITFAYTDWQLNILMFQNKIKAFYLRADTKILASQMSLKFLYYVSQNPNPCVLAIDVFIYINEETKFSWFPSFKPDREMYFKNPERRSFYDHGYTLIGNSVSITDNGYFSTIFSNTFSKGYLDFTINEKLKSFITSKSNYHKDVLITYNVLLIRQYKSVLQRSISYPVPFDIDPYSTHVNAVLMFYMVCTLLVVSIADPVLASVP